MARTPFARHGGTGAPLGGTLERDPGGDGAPSSRRLANEHAWLMAVAGVAALYYGARAALVGPLIDGDAVRDLFAALDIARHGTFYAAGPHVSGPGFDLGPAYYYLLAAPLTVWNSARAIPWWAAVWHVATIALVFDTTARLFSRRTGLVATALFVLSNMALSLHRPLTHSDLSPLLGLLVMRSLIRLQHGAPWALAGALFWAALALQFHALNATLFAAILLVVWIARPPLCWRHVVCAGCAAVLPFLPTLGPRPAPGDAAAGAIGLVPAAAAVLAAWWRPPLRSWRAAGLAAAMLLWALAISVLGLGALEGHPTFRLFNVVVPFDLFNWDGGSVIGAGSRWSLATTSSLLPENLLLLALAGYGSWLCVPAWRAAWRGDTGARRSPRLLLVVWVVATAPLGLLACALSPEARYLAHAWAPLSIAAALGAEALWDRHPAGWPARLARAHWLVPWIAALVAPLTWVLLLGWLPAVRDRAGSGPRRRRWQTAIAAGVPAVVLALLAPLAFEAFTPGSYAGAGHLVMALRGAAGLDDRAILRRVHGPLDERSAFLDVEGPSLFWLQFPASRPAARTDDGLEYLLVANGAPPLGAERLALGVRGLTAAAVRPALRADRAALEAGPGEPPAPVSLPYRFSYAIPPTFRRDSGSSFLPRAVSPAQDPAHVRLVMAREAPAQPGLTGIEVLISNVYGRRPADCDVRAEADGVPLPLQTRIGQEAMRWQFLLPHPERPARIEVIVAGCRFAYLDVYDV